MRTTLPPLLSLLNGVALLLLGTGLFNTLITLRAISEGFSETVIGLLTSGYFAGYLLGSWVTVPLIRRIGHIRAFALCAALATIVTLLHVVLVDPWVWLMLRLLFGIVVVTLYMVIESWLNAKATGDKRGQVFAVYMFVNLGALTVAQQLLHLESAQSFLLFALAAMLICAAAVPITLTRQAQPTLPEVPNIHVPQLFRVSRLAVVSAALAGLALSAFWGLAPLYASHRGFDASEVASLMSVTILGGALLQWPIGLFSDTHERPVVLLWIAGLATLVSLVMSQLPASTALWIAAFIWGGLTFSLYSVTVTHMIDRLPPEDVLAGTTGLLVINGFGAAIGPLVAGAVMGWLGPQGLPLFHAITLGTLTLFTFLRIGQVRELAKSHTPHVTMLRTSQTVLEMMPEVTDSPQQTGEADLQDEAEADSREEDSREEDPGKG
jgi:MFS family permease